MTEPRPARYFVNRETGTLCRVLRTDASYAYIEVVSPTQSRFALPRGEYDTTWLDTWEPSEDQRGPEGEPFELPANFSDRIGPSLLDVPGEDDEETT